MTDTIRCTRCIMDNSSDNTITFDENGYCNYCTNALASKDRYYYPNEEGNRRLLFLLDELKKNGEGRDYDCIMGVSGGLDSSYLAYLGYCWGLRILAVHVDDGFDTDISRENIKKLVEATGIELITLEPDATQFNALTKAYMKAGVPNLAAPQDNVLAASLYGYARKNRIKYFLSGANFSLESILQRGNTHSPYDVVNIRDIHKKYGEKPLDKLPFISEPRKELYKTLLNLKTVMPLNFIEYSRDQAFKELHDFCGFEYYGRKHLENILTAFVQLYWFPKKFGVDKRTSHLSSMIVSDQMTRDEALAEYRLPLYDEEMIEKYVVIVKNKLAITDDEFEEIMSAPTRQHSDYRIGKLYRLHNSAYKFLSRSKGVV